MGLFAENAKTHQWLYSEKVSKTLQLTLLNCFPRRLPPEELAQKNHQGDCSAAQRVALMAD